MSAILNITKRIIFLALLLFMIMFVSYNDSIVNINILSYEISVSFVFLIFLELIFVMLIIFLYRILDSLFRIPNYIDKRYYETLEKDNNLKLLDSYSLALMGKSDDSLNIAKDLINKFKDNRNQHLSLILSQKTKNINDHLGYLIKLFEISKYKEFAAKKLAYEMYNSLRYKDAIYYVKKINSYNSDRGLLSILIGSYNELKEYKLLQGLLDTVKILGSYEHKIKKLYVSSLYNGAIHFLSIDDTKYATICLEKALNVVKSDISCLELLTKIEANKKNNHNLLNILDEAFKNNPSIEIFNLYYKYNLTSKEELFERLSKLVDVSKFLGLFIIIAVILNKDDEVLHLKESILKKDNE